MKKNNTILRFNLILTLACVAALALAFTGPVAADQSSKKPPAAPSAPAKQKGKPKAKAGGPAKGKASDASRVVDVVKTLTPPQKMKLLDFLNKGETKALAGLPGVGKTRAGAIAKARPFKSIEELVKVEGVGLGVLEKIVKHAKAGYPAPKVEKGKAKTKGKSTPPKSKSKSKSKG